MAFRTAWLGFAAVLVTGTLQFAPIATEIFYRPSFRAKLAVLAIALATLVWLHAHVRRRAGVWDAGEPIHGSTKARGRAVAGALADRHRGRAPHVRVRADGEPLNAVMSFWENPTYAEFWLEIARGDLATWIQLTPYVYAVFEGIHLVGAAFFFGSIFLLDLRLLGFAPQLLAGPTGRFLLRIAGPAFAVLAVSGACCSCRRPIVTPRAPSSS